MESKDVAKSPVTLLRSYSYTIKSKNRIHNEISTPTSLKKKTIHSMTWLCPPPGHGRRISIEQFINQILNIFRLVLYILVWLSTRCQKLLEPPYKRTVSRGHHCRYRNPKLRLKLIITHHPCALCPVYLIKHGGEHLEPLFQYSLG